MIITVDGRLILVGQNNLKHLKHVLFDSLGIGATQPPFQLLAAAFLGQGHPALTPQFTVGEVEQEVGILVDRDVVVDRIVLAVFEGFEAINDDLGDRWTILHY